METLFWTVPIHSIKNHHKNVILDLIRFTPGGVSRVELAEKMGLTRAAISSIISDLLAEGVVREADSRATRAGRKPVVLEINPSGGYVAGVDIGASHGMVILADFSARILTEKEIAFDVRSGPEQCLFEIDLLLRDTLQQNYLAVSDLSAIGVGIPVATVTGTGSVSAPPPMIGWDDYPILDHLMRIWDRPICLNKDAELGALGEWAFGAGRGEKFLVFIKAGSGVRAGILLGGQIYPGATGTAGQIGHTAVVEGGPVCSCGKQGCLEAVCGGRAIVMQAEEAVRRNERTQLAYFDQAHRLSIHDVVEAARNGDLAAQQIMSNTGHHLGTAIAGLVNVLNPGMIVIGGSIAQVGDLLLDPVRQVVGECRLKTASRTVRITSALLGRRSVAMGGVVQALSTTLYQPQPRKEVNPQVNKLNIKSPVNAFLQNE